jgi:hypothetical protein
VNRSGAFVGALPEQQFVAAVLDLAGVEGQPETELADDPGEKSEAAAASDPSAESTPDTQSG